MGPRPCLWPSGPPQYLIPPALCTHEHTQRHFVRETGTNPMPTHTHTHTNTNIPMNILPYIPLTLYLPYPLCTHTHTHTHERSTLLGLAYVLDMHHWTWRPPPQPAFHYVQPHGDTSCFAMGFLCRCLMRRTNRNHWHFQDGHIGVEISALKIRSTISPFSPSGFRIQQALSRKPDPPTRDKTRQGCYKLEEDEGKGNTNGACRKERHTNTHTHTHTQTWGTT